MPKIWSSWGRCWSKLYSGKQILWPSLHCDVRRCHAPQFKLISANCVLGHKISWQSKLAGSRSAVSLRLLRTRAWDPVSKETGRSSGVCSPRTALCAVQKSVLWINGLSFSFLFHVFAGVGSSFLLLFLHELNHTGKCKALFFLTNTRSQYFFLCCLSPSCLLYCKWLTSSVLHREGSSSEKDTVWSPVLCKQMFPNNKPFHKKKRKSQTKIHI